LPQKVPPPEKPGKIFRTGDSAALLRARHSQIFVA